MSVPRRKRIDFKALVVASKRQEAPANLVVRLSKPRHAAGQGTLKARARQMSVYLEPAVYDHLREIAHHKRAKMHALILTAIDMFFKAEGSPSIEQLLKNSE